MLVLRHVIHIHEFFILIKITILSDCRSSHRRCSVIKGVLRNFVKFTQKHLCRVSFWIIKLQAEACNLLKKRVWHTCFPVNFAKFLRKPFLQNTSGRLLLWLLKLFICSCHLVTDRWASYIYFILSNTFFMFFYVRKHCDKWQFENWVSFLSLKF